MSKIYTKAGDLGATSLFGGTKVRKDNLQIEAYGTVDELNSFIGLLIAKSLEEKASTTLIAIQPILFDIGSHLASDGDMTEYLPTLNDDLVTHLEKCIDELDKELDPLKSFILPSGNERISLTHVCRTVCRRAERRIVAFNDSVELNPVIIKYLNRLSDYFFVLARWLMKQDGVIETKWNAK